MHTLIVGNEDTARHSFLEKLLEKSGVSAPIGGFRTTMSEEDSEGNARIHIHPLKGSLEFCDDNMVGLCKNRRSTAYPEVFDRFSYLLENMPEEGVILMDGLGPMEGEAPRFREAVLKALDGEVPILASVRDKDTEFLRAVRNHPKARCFIMGSDDDMLFNEVLEFFEKQIFSAAPSKERD